MVLVGIYSKAREHHGDTGGEHDDSCPRREKKRTEDQKRDDSDDRNRRARSANGPEELHVEVREPIGTDGGELEAPDCARTTRSRMAAPAFVALHRT